MPSIEKKRARDRRSQQSLRDRKQRHIAELEELVAHCHANHQTHGEHDAHSREVSALRHQNKSLLQRQEFLKSLVMSWDEPSLEISSNYKQPAAAIFPPLLSDAESISNTPTSSALTEYEPTLSQDVTPSEPSLPAIGTPDWSRIPPHDDDYDHPETVVGCGWFQYPELIRPCPDTPHSPLDILYGSKLNPLADMIHDVGERRPFREPERLAAGWIAYLITRWVCAPSPTTYGALPGFLRPVREQLDTPHPVALDMVPWPKVRVALIRDWARYRDNYSDFFGLLACCIRIRWPWGESVLERAADNTLVMRDDFYETFTSDSGWTITREFVDQYPKLFAGVDVDSILYRFM